MLIRTARAMEWRSKYSTALTTDQRFARHDLNRFVGCQMTGTTCYMLLYSLIHHLRKIEMRNHRSNRRNVLLDLSRPTTSCSFLGSSTFGLHITDITEVIIMGQPFCWRSSFRFTPGASNPLRCQTTAVTEALRVYEYIIACCINSQVNEENLCVHLAVKLAPPKYLGAYSTMVSEEILMLGRHAVCYYLIYVTYFESNFYDHKKTVHNIFFIPIYSFMLTLHYLTFKSLEKTTLMR